MSDATRPISVETLLAERPWVESLARHLVRSDAAAADVVQETWLAALEHPPREPSAVRGWLSRVVRNEAFLSMRRAARRERWESAAPPPPLAESPDVTVARADAHRRVVDAVMSLDEPYRTAVLLRFFEGLESDEVARRTRVPVETARTRVKRALAILRGRLDRDHGGDGRAWAVALAPLVGAKKGLAAAAATATATATEGAVMGATLMKTAVAAAVVGGLAGSLLTVRAMSPRDSESAPETAAAPDPRPQSSASAPRAPQRRASQVEAVREASLARVIDEIPADLPPPGDGVISGHVKSWDGTPVAGVVVRSFARRDAGTAAAGASRSIEDSVRSVVIDEKWRTATARETTTGADGAFSLTALADAPHHVEVAMDGCEVAPSAKTDLSAVRPGATIEFVVNLAHVPVTVLMPDATPAAEKVLVRFLKPDGSGGAHPRDWWWMPEAQAAPVMPGTWTVTAEIGQTLRSQPVELRAPAGGAVPSLTLRLQPADPSAVAKASGTKDPKILSALDWLKKGQAAEGDWGDPAATGAALLAYLGAGETHLIGPYRDVVTNAWRYLRDRQDTEGSFVARTGTRWLRDHAVAALATVEAYGMTGSRFYKDPAQRAVAFAMKARAPSSGWGIEPGRADVDVETTGWMILLAKSAQGAQIDVDASALSDAVAAIDRVTDHATGRVIASSAGGSMSDEAATAIGVLTRLFAGHTPAGDAMIAKGAAFVAARPPSWDSGRTPDYAAWYFGTLALFQVGGDEWRAWNAALKSAVIDRQRADDGSWDAAASGASEGDRVWATALNLLCTEVWLRYGKVVGAK